MSQVIDFTSSECCILLFSTVMHLESNSATWCHRLQVIDRNYYPVEEARRSNMRHRPVGLGVQGLADAFLMMNLGLNWVGWISMSTGGHFGCQIVVKNLEVKPRKLPFESEDARRLNEVGLMFKQLKISTWQRFVFLFKIPWLLCFFLRHYVLASQIHRSPTKVNGKTMAKFPSSNSWKRWWSREIGPEHDPTVQVGEIS